MQVNWKPLERNYIRENLAYKISGKHVSTHPLKYTKTQPAFSNASFNVLAANNQNKSNDPLSTALNSFNNVKTHKNDNFISELEKAVTIKDPEWIRQKASLISQYLKNDNSHRFVDDYFDLEMTLPGINCILEKFTDQFFVFKNPPTEILPTEFTFETLTDCIKYLYAVENNILYFWNENDRLSSLNILIETLNVLEDVWDNDLFAVIMVIQIEIFDVFSSLVYKRMLELEQENKNAELLSSYFKSDFDKSVYLESNLLEIGWNWIYKVESIISPFQRILVKMVIFKCYQIIVPNYYSSHMFASLIRSIRGISNPVLALYVRYYASRVIHLYFPEEKDHFVVALQDFEREYVELKLHDKLFPYSKVAPAICWIIYTLFSDSSLPFCRHHFAKLMEYNSCPLFLCSLIRFTPDIVVMDYILRIFDMIGEMDDSVTSKYIGCIHMGRLLNRQSNQQNYMMYLKKAWNIIDSISSKIEYLSVVVVWSEFVARFFQTKQIDSMIASVADRFYGDDSSGTLYQQNLYMFLKNIVTFTSNVIACFNLTSFRIVLQLITDSGNEIDICATILSRVLEDGQMMTDRSSIDAVLEVIGIINENNRYDSSLPTGTLIENDFIKFVESVLFGDDFEQQLQFYCDVRARAFKFPNIIIRVIHYTVRLITHVFFLRHDDRTSELMRSCSAFLLITIPSINNVFERLRISPLCLHVAFITRCVGQGQAIMNLMLKDFGLLFRDYRELLGNVDDCVAAFLSSIVLIPDDPFGEMNQYFTEFVDLIIASSISPSLKSKYLTWGVVTVSSMWQKSYVINLRGVSANDLLYGGDPRFRKLLNSLGVKIISELNKLFSGCRDYGGMNSCDRWSEEYLWTVVCCSDLTNSELVDFFHNSCFVHVPRQNGLKWFSTNLDDNCDSYQSKQNNIFMTKI